MNQANKLQDQLDAYERSQMTIFGLIGNEAKKFFLSNFEKRGFTDKSFEKWAKRKDDLPHPLLEKTGDLKRSIRVSDITNNSVTIRSDVGYGSFLNDGTRKMPQREFIGNSEVINKKVEEIIQENIKKIFK